MPKKHAVEYKGTKFIRISNKVYSHVVIAKDEDGYYVFAWASSLMLAERQAKRAREEIGLTDVEILPVEEIKDIQ